MGQSSFQYFFAVLPDLRMLGFFRAAAAGGKTQFLIADCPWLLTLKNLSSAATPEDREAGNSVPDSSADAGTEERAFLSWGP